MNNTLKHYLICALWASIDDAGEPLDRSHSIQDFSPSALAEVEKEISDFCDANKSDIDASGLNQEQIGHDFFLTRNGHGAGFWDRYSQTTCQAYEREQKTAMQTRDFSAREALTKTCPCAYHACSRLAGAARVYGSNEPYAGDDGALYFHG